jgi:hypothetical protein
MSGLAFDGEGQKVDFDYARCVSCTTVLVLWPIGVSYVEVGITYMRVFLESLLEGEGQVKDNT